MHVNSSFWRTQMLFVELRYLFFFFFFFLIFGLYCSNWVTVSHNWHNMLAFSIRLVKKNLLRIMVCLCQVF